ncbi:MAG: M1 family metallopeptidase [Acidobacteria bacterium]|nr:M1 family metallopeptidase [Acidobacteriota bacterium]
MRRLLIFALLVAPPVSAQDSDLQSAATAAALRGVIVPPLSPRNANYTIAAQLDPATRTIAGSETITWRNITSKPAVDLEFHLYWNAWKNPRSTFMRERAMARQTGGAPPAANDWSHIDVTSIVVSRSGSAPATLTASKRFIAPDDENPDDETVMAVPLPEPVAPGETVTIDVKWSAHVPRTFARTGAIGNFFFIAQWFPKLGVLQETGWNCHQFHAATEFFADYGVYDVSLTLPRTFVAGATGVLREKRDNADGTTTHRYYQEDVHDFAWTTSPDYLERSARFEPDAALRGTGAPGLSAVDMRLLLQPEHAGQAERHFDATRTTLRYYGEWYGAYPYGHITIVDPAFQSNAGGMEYPTLFTAGTRWIAPAHVTTPEGVTVHEAGHQFWYGIVGNNEFEDAWMDEGFNTFSTARAVAQVYDPNYLAVRYFGGFVPWVFTDVVISRETDGNRLSGYRRDARSDAQATQTIRYFPSTASSITYNKTALWLNTLERWLGWPTVQRIMAAHFDRGKFKHPTPQDFFATASEVAGRDLTPFFDQVYRSSNVFDYGVQDLQTAHEGDRYRTTVIVRRYGEAIFPVDVLVTFKDGERVTEHWDGKDRWKLYSYDGAAAAISAQVDPNRVLLLDVDYTNNSKTLEPKGSTAATKWSLKWMVWLQDCLLSWVALV